MMAQISLFVGGALLMAYVRLAMPNVTAWERWWAYAYLCVAIVCIVRGIMGVAQ